MIRCLALSLCVVVFGGTARAQLACPAPDAPGPYTIETLAGTGEAGMAGDGGPATDALLDHPSAVAVAPDGTVYVADSRNHRVRRIGRDGVITTVAGTGERGYNGDGIPATEASLTHPYGVTIGPDGLVYVADQAAHRIRRIEADGTITTVAGTGENGGGGDGGPATEASLSFPNHVAFDGRGGMVVGEGGGDRVRYVASDGTITTVAGIGRARYNRGPTLHGDGGPAVEAALNVVGAVAVGADGSLYIADLRNHAVRRVGPDGRIETVAGTGVPGYNGDRADARTAQLDQPGGVAALPDGSVVIADGSLGMVRVITPSGALCTIAGLNEQGYSGDGGPARLANLSVLDILTTDDEGNIYVSDYGNNAVRVLRPGGTRPDPARDPLALLVTMRDAYARLDGVDVTFEERRDGEVRSGRVRYRAGGVLDAAFEIPDYGTVEVTGDGYRLTVRDPMRPTEERLDHAPRALTSSLIGNLPVYALVDADRQLSVGEGGHMDLENLGVTTETWDGRRWIVLHEASNSTRYRYFVDPDTFLMWRAVRDDEEGTRVSYESRVTSLRLFDPNGR